MPSNRLDSGQELNLLNPGQSLRSTNGFHVLAMQDDGNLVLYSLGKAIWASNTAGMQVDTLLMQDDGNLVIYAPGGHPIWASGTHGNGSSTLLMQDDRNVVIYRDDGTPTWSTNTPTAPEIWVEETKLEMSLETKALLDANPSAGAIVSSGVGISCPVTLEGFIV